MRLADFRVAVRPGAGVVARFPTVLLVVGDGDWASNPAIGRIVQACQAPEEERSAATRLRAVIAEAGDALPAFSAVADSDDGLAILVHGDAQVSISGGQPVVALNDQHAGSWGAHIHDRVASLVLGGPGAGGPGAETSWLDLRDGVVPGGGAVLVSRAETPADELAVPATSVACAPAPAAAPAPAPAPALAAAAAPAPVPPEEPAERMEVMVWGINCKGGHFNNPDARYCRMCGMHMVHQRRDLVLGPRPVVGYLVLDDGSTYKLDTDYLIGRQPEPDRSATGAAGGESRTLVLSDPEGTVSPTHASVHLNEWEVLITDRGSHFGTHVWTPGAAEWLRLDDGQSQKLEPRSHVLLGRRQLVFEPVNRRSAEQ